MRIQHRRASFLARAFVAAVNLWYSDCSTSAIASRQLVCSGVRERMGAAREWGAHKLMHGSSRKVLSVTGDICRRIGICV